MPSVSYFRFPFKTYATFPQQFHQPFSFNSSPSWWHFTHQVWCFAKPFKLMNYSWIQPHSPVIIVVHIIKWMILNCGIQMNSTSNENVWLTAYNSCNIISNGWLIFECLVYLKASLHCIKTCGHQKSSAMPHGPIYSYCLINLKSKHYIIYNTFIYKPLLNMLGSSITPLNEKR